MARNGQRVKFELDDDTTASITSTETCYHKVFALQQRLAEIENEYKSIGAIRTNAGKPILPSHYRNKAWFLHPERIPAIERKMKAGKELEHWELSLLKHTVLVDTDGLNASIDKLYAEECDIWLSLRKYELAGLKLDLGRKPPTPA